MMQAIISDIHGNQEAVEAVLHDISAQGIDRIWCLGDIVGYGPNPKECVDLVQRNCELCLMGNHDWAVLNAPLGFNPTATRMIYRTKDWLQITEESTDRERQRWEFLSEMPLRHIQDEFHFVHASPRAELSEYILPMDVKYDPNKLREIFEMVGSHCIVGHTHVPCCITEDFEVFGPEEIGSVVELGEKRMIINVGSVGQPRDGDNRACFVILDDGIVRYRRVPYNFEKTVEKIFALGPDYEMLGERLRIGR